MARHVLKGEVAVTQSHRPPPGARAMKCSDGHAETSMIGETPPGRKGARAPRLSEASTAAASDQSSPASSSSPMIEKEKLSRKQKSNQRRKEKRREKRTEEQKRAREEGPRFFTIHEEDSEEWQSVCSQDLDYEDRAPGSKASVLKN